MAGSKAKAIVTPINCRRFFNKRTTANSTMNSPKVVMRLLNNSMQPHQVNKLSFQVATSPDLQPPANNMRLRKNFPVMNRMPANFKINRRSRATQNVSKTAK